MTYENALTYLYNVAPPFHEVGAAAYKPGLDTMRKMMQALGLCEPYLSIPLIHVAGTNGKGSTSHLMVASMAAAGYKVGLYTSPHLVDFAERVRIINGQRILAEKQQSAQSDLPVIEYIPESYVAAFVEQHTALFEELHPSFFEITTALAFCWLAEQKVDVAVIEVGLGGLLDATNIVQPTLSVITNIGLDHIDLLGSTLASIATQKAGIMKPGVPCVIGETHPETQQVFISRAEECGILGEGLETTDCHLWFADQCAFLRRQRMRVAPDCQLRGTYQQANMQTAYVALQAFNQLAVYGQQAADKRLFVPQSAITDGYVHVVTYTGLRGRWETLSTAPLTICDTGHNSHGISTYVEQLRETVRRRSSNGNKAVLRIVFGMVADKDIDDVLRLLPADAVYYFAQPDSHRAFSAVAMLGKWQTIYPEAQANAYESIYEALACAREEAAHEDVIFIGGSNYLVGEAIKIYS